MKCPDLRPTSLLHFLSDVHGIYLQKKAELSSWASTTSAWRHKLSVSLIMLRFMIAATQKTAISSAGETVFSKLLLSIIYVFLPFCTNRLPTVSDYMLDKISLSSGCYRFCGSDIPPVLTSSGPVMSVVFVADEGVADSGFYASYKVISLSESEFLNRLWAETSLRRAHTAFTFIIINNPLHKTSNKIADINEQI